MSEQLELFPLCGNPRCGNPVPTTNANDALWVALGEVVCSKECHEAMYELENEP